MSYLCETNAPCVAKSLKLLNRSVHIAFLPPCTVYFKWTFQMKMDGGGVLQVLFEPFKEHLKDPSPIHHHSNHTGHPTSQINFQIIGRQGHGLARNIKESILIRVNNPSLNKNIGNFNLPHIWDRVLLNTPGSYLKKECAGCWANSNTSLLNQPNLCTHLDLPKSPIVFQRFWACS